MLEQLIQFTQSTVTFGGPLGVFFAAIFEEIVFFIPSPIVPMAAGFFLLSSNLEVGELVIRNIFYVAIPVGIGLSIGSLFPYCICYFGGRPAIEKWGRFVGLNWRHIEIAEKKFVRGYRDEIILLVLRILPIAPSVAISGFCGFMRYPVYRYLAVTIVGAAIRGFLLGVLGWYVGSAYVLYAEMISQSEKYIFACGVVLMVSTIVWYAVRKKYK